MALSHGQTPPFDMSTVSDPFVTLRYGPTISGYGFTYWRNDYEFLINSQFTDLGFSDALRRYIVKYNPITNKYEHLETQKTCRGLYEDQKTIVDVSILNCLHQVHGSGISEPMPSGLLDELPKVFDRPLLGQKMFIDCCTKAFFAYPSGQGFLSIIVSGQYSTKISRYGVLKDDQVLYFKNCIGASSGFIKKTEGSVCLASPPIVGSCCISGVCVSDITESQCLKMNGFWQVSGFCPATPAEECNMF